MWVCTAAAASYFHAPAPARPTEHAPASGAASGLRVLAAAQGRVEVGGWDLAGEGADAPLDAPPPCPGGTVRPERGLHLPTLCPLSQGSGCSVVPERL